MTDMLQITNLHKTFNPGTPNENHVLKGVSLTLKEGDYVTVIGGNGAGKSTLLNSIAGTIGVDSGEIRIDSVDVTRLPEHKRAGLLGRVFQDPMQGTAAKMSVSENLALAARRGKHRGLRWGLPKGENQEFIKALEMLGLGLERRLDDKIGLLSGGQRQAITLIMATMQKPKLLLLDEHTAALDPATAEKVLEITRQTVSENRITTLMVTHNMHQALELGNRTLMMDRGHIILDVAGAERAGMTVEDLLAKFKSGAGKALDNDRILLSEQTKSNKKGASNAAD